MSVAGELYKQGNEAMREGLAVFDLEWANIKIAADWSIRRYSLDIKVAQLCFAYADGGVNILRLRLHPKHFLEVQEAGFQAAKTLKDVKGASKRLCNVGIAYK